VPISDKAWDEGIDELNACCETFGGITQRMAEIRASIMKAELGHMSDEEWLFAVRICARTGKWPSIEALQEAALQMPKKILIARDANGNPLIQLASPNADDVDQVSREDAKRGLELIRAALAAQAVAAHHEPRAVARISVPKPGRSMPIVDSQERRAALAEQAKLILQEPSTGPSTEH
jgi:hypothetical protein